jgi:uncharacterized protein
MADWTQEVEPLTVKGQIRVPYRWSVGEIGSRFLTSLRDHGKILANRCGGCHTVYVPPRKNCARCFEDIDDWTEVGPEGTVEAFTIIREAHPIQPADVPFAYVLVRLDGSDVGLLHLVRNGWEGLTTGSRVRAVFRAERTGHILDIDCFELI